MKWWNEASPWLKLGVGVAGLVVVGVIAIGFTAPAALAVVMAGAVVGGANAYNESRLHGGDHFDRFMSAGIGAAFGAICPVRAFGGAIGSVVVGGAASLSGASDSQIATAYSAGGMIGGLAGGFYNGAKALENATLRSRLGAGLIAVGPDLLGGGIGAIGGYWADGSSTGALHGAFLGMMIGSAAGGLSRGVWGTRRAVIADGVAPTSAADDFVNGWRRLSVDDVPLPAGVKSTFRGGTAVGKVFEEDVVLYRVYGGTAGRTGSYLTRVKPRSPSEAIKKLALDPDWGNSAVHLFEVEVPRGTVIWEGAARHQGTLRGG
ncbi:hypothetical protein [Blastopirellula marina]|uniref:RHS-family protein n=1 Tax=Blastopirellula marina DSM 3645 TaxID=314230 RepID=A3ZWF1_9BACT|nr:hypothetical protein [Blastopirellula marina]EAQ79179.1 RHS-family protein [Blastopirellula marina DSM 3645]